LLLSSKTGKKYSPRELIVEAVSLFVFGFFYDVRWWLHPLELFAVCALATWGIAILGAAFGAMTVNLKLRELMLPVLIYPLLMPLLMAAIELTNNLLMNQVTVDSLLWGRVLLVFDIVYTSLGIALAETILVN